ncbi:SPFH domain / Band 7 family [Cardiobacterium valvarum]|uniref:SPFH domain / Band 7 family n=1 Tax=Cardiobacterium valvarum TaxID=194702 RepID=A0A381EAZ8_9GAMM|nr:SPFH domain-containing protein [Cardiobacterium valvarum]SUX24152.1 SPFH domain / Band 7 family [Cardiobacterium valvarum]
MTEKPKVSFSGLPVLIAALLFLGFYFIASIDAKNEASIILGFPLLALVIFVMSGCYKLEPNQAVVLSFFGKYSGTVRDTGLRWNNPLYQKKKISLRVRNFESGRLKVNELDGSPIEIAAVIVWQVEGAAEAVYNVDDYESFVHIQSEAALRAMATSYPYDQHEEGQLALRSHAAEISAHLQSELTDRLVDAGVAVLDARISHLAYTPEIAQAMLQRQQANVVIAALSRIVTGAVSMVEAALAQLQTHGTVKLDDAQKAAIVGNLLVVLCSERGSQPTINAGS